MFAEFRLIDNLIEAGELEAAATWDALEVTPTNMLLKLLERVEVASKAVALDASLEAAASEAILRVLMMGDA